MSIIERLLTRGFGAPEEINGGERCPTYMFRWHVFKWPRNAEPTVDERELGEPPEHSGGDRLRVYVHKFVADDWSRDLHDHPKRFISIGLWGSYIEETPQGERVYRAPWIRTFPAEHVHRLRLRSRVCWTLVITLRAVRPWGFYHEGAWVPWREYVEGSAADARVSCE